MSNDGSKKRECQNKNVKRLQVAFLKFFLLTLTKEQKKKKRGGEGGGKVVGWGGESKRNFLWELRGPLGRIIVWSLLFGYLIKFAQN